MAQNHPIEIRGTLSGDFVKKYAHLLSNVVGTRALDKIDLHDLAVESLQLCPELSPIFNSGKCSSFYATLLN